MKLDGRMTLLVDGQKVLLELKDNTSCRTFLTAEINPVDFCAMLGRLAGVPVEFNVYALNKLGKNMVMDTFEFKMPKCEWKEQKKIASETVKKLCPKGWEADEYFNSQNSFFTKDNAQWARTTIRKWE